MEVLYRGRFPFTEASPDFVSVTWGIGVLPAQSNRLAEQCKGFRATDNFLGKAHKLIAAVSW
jgi:hypothetical protein